MKEKKKTKKKPYDILAVTVIVAAMLGISLFAGNPASASGTVAQTQSTDQVRKENEEKAKQYIAGTLFAGDGNTLRYEKYTDNATNETFTGLDNTIGVVGMTVADIPILPVMEFATGTVTLPEAVQLIQPQRVFLSFGASDLLTYETPEEFTEAYAEGIRAITDAYEYTDILVNSISPVSKNTTYTNITIDGIKARNEAIRTMCEENGWTYMDTFSALSDNEGYLKPIFAVGDGMHLSQSGIQEVFDYIRANMLTTEDRRPADRGETPQIIGAVATPYEIDPLTWEPFEDEVLYPSGSIVTPTWDTTKHETESGITGEVYGQYYPSYDTYTEPQEQTPIEQQPVEEQPVETPQEPVEPTPDSGTEVVPDPEPVVPEPVDPGTPETGGEEAPAQ